MVKIVKEWANSVFTDYDVNYHTQMIECARMARKELADHIESSDEIRLEVARMNAIIIVKDIEMLQLLEASHDIDVCQRFGERCHGYLTLAIIWYDDESKCLETCKFLLSTPHKKTLIRMTDISGQTALHYAISQEKKEVIELLLHNGADVNAADNFGSTPFLNASKFASIEICYLLIDFGANFHINSKDTIKDSPLWCIYERFGRESHDFVRFLLGYSVDPNPRGGPCSYPLLTLAVSKNDLPMVKILHEFGADLDVLSMMRDTPLHIAMLLGYYEIAEFLVKNGAKMDGRNVSGTMPIMAAIEKGYFCGVKLFVENGFKIDIRTEGGRSVMEKAFAKTDVRIIAYLTREYMKNIDEADLEFE